MAVRATLGLQLEVVVRTLAAVTIRARNRLMPAIERERRSTVLLDREQRGPEALLVMARLAIDAPEGPAMHVSVAVRTSIELETAISALCWKLWGMASRARNPPM